MTLVVEAPPAYEPERRYILGAVLGDWLGLDWRLRVGERSDVRITSAADSGSRYVSIPEGLFATEPRQWLTAASLPRSPLPWRPVTAAVGAPPLERSLPVLFGAPGAPATLLSANGEGVRMGVDVLGSAFFMLTRYEELVVAARDGYGRFPAAASIAHREGFLTLPIVDAYVELLWSGLRRVWPRLARRPREFRVALTHDVDDPLAFRGRSAAKLARQLGADALLRRDPALAVRRVRSWTGVRRGDYRHDPYNTFNFLMDVSERNGLASAFNFIATEDTSERNGFYTVDDPWIQDLMRTIGERGHEIGFHAGFDTYRDPERTAHEFDRLRTAATRLQVAPARWGGRQHYLRWENPGTWSNWERAGLQYDSTVGFADHVGFRAGTANEFGVFDLLARRPLNLRERPLHVMDGTLIDHMKLTGDAAAQATLDVARQCRRMKGTFTLLWHNSALPAAKQQRWYAALAAELVRPL